MIKTTGKKFCPICGKERKKMIIRYNEYTGKPIYGFEICDVKDCDHGYHEHKWYSSKCIKCGKTFRVCITKGC